MMLLFGLDELIESEAAAMVGRADAE